MQTLNEELEQKLTKYKEVWTEEALAMNYLPEGGLQIDIGACWGFWTLTMLKKAEKVWAFEPQKEVAEQHLDTIKHPNLTVWKIALSNKIETTTLYIRLYEKGIIHEFVGLIKEYHKTPYKETKITTITLDSLYDLIKLQKTPLTAIKIDTEGAEHLILEGAQKTIQTYKPTLIIEYHNNIQQIENITKQHNYKETFHIHRSWLDKEGYNNGIKVFNISKNPYK